MSNTFGWAVEALKAGQRVTRSGWNGKGMWLGLQRPDSHSKMSLPYIYMKTAQGDLVPWLASQTDVLAEDWQEFAVDPELKAYADQIFGELAEHQAVSDAAMARYRKEKEEQHDDERHAQLSLDT